MFVLPQESGFIHSTTVKKNVRTLTKMCSFAQPFFNPEEITEMFEEFLPYVRLLSFRPIGLTIYS